MHSSFLILSKVICLVNAVYMTYNVGSKIKEGV